MNLAAAASMAGPVDLEVDFSPHAGASDQPAEREWQDCFKLQSPMPVTNTRYLPSAREVDGTHVLVPLPAPLWSGIAGLAATAVILTIRRLKRAL